MARGNLPRTEITRVGVAPAGEVTGDAANNHHMTNDGKCFLLVRNSNGGSTARIVTFHLSGTIDGQTVTPRAVSVAAGASVYLGPFPPNVYGRDLLVDVAHADLKLSAYHLAT